ncbi:MAG: bifunctional [glutamate--ammonia ligase]-adenylyl-L-tyrosine phosphorylase/[glutamate--ammonia-ligase] adenylyltransferase, partial [Pseudomonadota bacterium]
MSTLESLPEQVKSHWETINLYFDTQGINQTDRKKIERLASASNYAFELIKNTPELIPTLLVLDRFELDESIISFDQNERVDLDQARQQLRCYRHQKLAEIIYLDVVGKHSVPKILAYLSDLADQLIGCAVTIAAEQLSRKHGRPVNDQGRAIELNVIAMGKLGGRELNFSSDVDLICTYESDGELQGYGQLTYQEFFSRQVRLMSQLLSDTTSDGFVYRVDLRLRPWGDSGPSVLSHSALEHYYQLHGREWEQYAMVKARIITGSEQEKRQLELILKPFVYRKYHDYRVFEGLAGLKDKIDAQAKSRNMRINIKVGQGGIREIEFFVQAFQILKGGRNHALQTTEILIALPALKHHKIIDSKTIEKLTDAYLFLRKLENRIQMFDDQQTHDLPEDASIQSRVMRGMEADSWQALTEQLEIHRQCVSQCFTDLFQHPAESASNTVIDDGFVESEEEHQWDFIQNSGIENKDTINRQLTTFVKSKSWRFMSARAKQRFNTLLPELIEKISGNENSDLLFSYFMRLFGSISGRSVYFELLFQNPALLEKLASLFAQSAWIAEEVSQYPMLLENLIQPGDQTRFDRETLMSSLMLQLDNVSGDVELELDTLRLFKREQTLVIASAELGGEIDTAEVGRYLCQLAEVILEAVYQLATQALETQYGVPQCVDQGKLRQAQFAIIGYGKLGGLELHYQSDLDVIFLHNSCGEQQFTNGEKPLENSVYFARLAQKIISMTSVLTASGKLYEIDSRLRPEGSSGLLVSSLQAYQQYQLEKAWTWEHQALVRARQVAGDSSISTRFNTIRETILKLPRSAEQLGSEIVDMRLRMFSNKRLSDPESFDIKHSRGGMVDIEFMVQYWVLLHANNIGSDQLNSDNIGLL